MSVNFHIVIAGHSHVIAEASSAGSTFVINPFDSQAIVTVSVDYAKVVPLLVEAIKDLSKELEEVKKQLKHN